MERGILGSKGSGNRGLGRNEGYDKQQGELGHEGRSKEANVELTLNLQKVSDVTVIESAAGEGVLIVEDNISVDRGIKEVEESEEQVLIATVSAASGWGSSLKNGNRIEENQAFEESRRTEDRRRSEGWTGYDNGAECDISFGKEDEMCDQSMTVEVTNIQGRLN